MGYLNELLSRNPLVIDGDTIRPHHKYTDDLYMGSENKMTNYDRIKSMSVEEMAHLIAETADYDNLIWIGGEWRTAEELKQWLLQEVSENE